MTQSQSAGSKGKNLQVDFSANTATKVLALIAAAFAAISLFGAMIGEPFQSGFLDLDTEQSVPTIFAVLLVFSASGLAALVAYFDRAERRTWLFIAAALAFVAVDEGISIHEVLIEPVRDRVDANGLLYFAWVIPYSVGLVGFVVITVPFLRRIAPSRRNAILLAGAVFVAGALGMEMIGASYAEDHGRETRIYNLLATVEESLEMGGMILMVRFLLNDLAALATPILVRFRK